MVVLILTPSGFEAMRRRVVPAEDAVWINAGVLSDAEVDALRAAGWDLSRFSNPLDVNRLDGALDTIRLHHPDQVIWMEQP